MKETPEQWFHRRASYYVEAQVLFHLNRAGVFSCLDERGPMSVEALAARLSLVPEVLRTCLDYVEGVDGIIETDERGRIGFTDFGRAVLSRYGRDDGDEKRYNLFDVRVGAYGPVWEGLGGLLRGELRYGESLLRRGDQAAEALYVVGSRLVDTLYARLAKLAVRSVVEVGVSTGLSSLLRQRNAELGSMGLDRSADALRSAEARATAAGHGDIVWRCADFFEPDTWVNSLEELESPLALFSVHFHELLSRGPGPTQDVLRVLGRARPGIRVLAMEQPRPSMNERKGMEEVPWLYSQSNILIHHLIGNGRILSVDGWTNFFEGSGGTIESRESMGYLGYELWVVRLGGGI